MLCLQKIQQLTLLEVLPRFTGYSTRAGGSSECSPPPTAITSVLLRFGSSRSGQLFFILRWRCIRSSSQSYGKVLIEPCCCLYSAYSRPYWWTCECIQGTCLLFGWLLIFESHATTARLLVQCRHTVCLQCVYDVCIWPSHLKAAYWCWKGPERRMILPGFHHFLGGSLGLHAFFQNTQAAGGFNGSSLTGNTGHEIRLSRGFLNSCSCAGTVHM